MRQRGEESRISCQRLWTITAAITLMSCLPYDDDDDDENACSMLELPKTKARHDNLHRDIVNGLLHVRLSAKIDNHCRSRETLLIGTNGARHTVQRISPVTHKQLMMCGMEYVE